jgi:succinylglutamic semialdehyde dehydrogenase
MHSSLYINGGWIQGKGEPFRSHDPASGDIVWQGASATESDIDAALLAAKHAFTTWSVTPLDDRILHIKQFQGVVQVRQDALAELIAREMGKPLWDARTEVKAVLAKIDISLTAYHERTGMKNAEAGGVRQELRHRPLGPMVVFGPYNFPAHLPNGHIIPALIAGNTVVFKPSEQTPAVGAFYAECWQEAGLPAGVFNMVQGAKETGVALVAHPEIAGVLFTGSYPTGRAIHRALAGKPEIQLALEMGGNNPQIVWDAADTEAAAKLVLQSAYLTSGQRCTCARRLILPQDAAGDALLEALVSLIKRLRIGAWNETPEPFMGPLVNAHQAQAVLTAQEVLEAQGGRILMAASPLTQDATPSAFITPGLMDVTAVSDRPDEEIFGPLLQVIRVATFDDALREANRTAYGLSAGLLSDDAGLWEMFRSSIHAGIVNWNRPLTGASSAAPFGGMGKSGNLRPSAYYAADYVAHPVSTLAQDNVNCTDSIIGLTEPE